MRAALAIALLTVLMPGQAMAQRSPPPDPREPSIVFPCMDMIGIGTFDVLSTVQLGDTVNGRMRPTIFKVRVTLTEQFWHAEGIKTFDAEWSGAPALGKPAASMIFRKSDAQGNRQIAYVQPIVTDAKGRRFLAVFDPQDLWLREDWRTFARRIDMALPGDLFHPGNARVGYTEHNGEGMIVRWGIPVSEIARMYRAAAPGSCSNY